VDQSSLYNGFYRYTIE